MQNCGLGTRNAIFFWGMQEKNLLKMRNPMDCGRGGNPTLPIHSSLLPACANHSDSLAKND
jgi:hypothetical protein